jgi:hypothetical protein
MMRGYVKRLHFLPVFLITAAVVWGFSGFTQDTKTSKSPKEISYSKDVAPILEKFCATCHNEDEDHPSQLFMDTYESLMKGGKHGQAVKPGTAKESLLLQKMDAEPPFGKKMPPSKKLIPTDEQVEVLRQWIDQGAKKN